MGTVETAVQVMTNLAIDDSHGYDQRNRWGPDYDCSSAVIASWEAAGVPVYQNGATYTGNMYNAFIKSGFKDVTATVNLWTGKGLIRGDVLLVHAKNRQHTAMYIGNGLEAEASINEYGKAVGGKTGDQTGREILVRNYRSHYFTKVLRYSEMADTSDDETTKIAKEVIQGKWGNGATRKRRLENAGYDYLKVQKCVNDLLK